MSQLFVDDHHITFTGQMAMTAQIAETLHMNGEVHSLCAHPLGPYFELSGIAPPFDDFYCTALWRGYVGTWEITNARLYLIGLKGWVAGQEAPVGMEMLFPGFPERVFAHWFTGELRIPQGRLLNYEHMGYLSRYERDCFITVRQGVITGERIQVNGVAAEDERDCYVVAAATFHR